MHLIIGGRCQGKLRFAKRTYGECVSISDLAYSELESAMDSDVLINLQHWVKNTLAAGGDPCQDLLKVMDKLSSKVFIGEENGCGIVPTDDFERNWRDETGRVYQLIASRADRVDRVWAGIEQRLK